MGWSSGPQTGTLAARPLVLALDEYVLSFVLDLSHNGGMTRAARVCKQWALEIPGLPSLCSILIAEAQIARAGEIKTQEDE